MGIATVRERYERSLAAEIVDELIRIEIVDRALALASKLFVAVIPLSILITAVVPGAGNFGESLVSRFELTGAGRSATLALFASRGTVRGGVSVVGLVILFYSVFSFTRGLQRVYLDIWGLPPQKLEALLRRATWMAGFVLYLGVLSPVRGFGQHHHLTGFYPITAVLLGAVFWVWSPYILLGRRLPWQRLLPTGLITATGIAVYTLASVIYMPIILTHNAQRYGLIGIAFGLVTWLFAYSGVVVGCAVVGHSWDVHHGGSETATG